MKGPIDIQQLLDMMNSSSHSDEALVQLNQAIKERDDFLEITSQFTHKVDLTKLTRFDFINITSTCFNRVKTKSDLSTQDFTKFITILSNLKYRKSLINDFCSEYIKLNINNFYKQEISFIARFVADSNITDNQLLDVLCRRITKEYKTYKIPNNIEISYALQRILQTQSSLLDLPKNLIKQCRDDCFIEAVDKRNRFSPNAYQMSQLFNIYTGIKNSSVTIPTKINSIISETDVNNWYSARHQIIKKNTTPSDFHDSVFKQVKELVSGAEEEKWLKNAASSVDIFIPKESIGATKDIVIQVDGTGYHNYNGDGTSSAKTIHNTKDLEDAGYIVIRGNKENDILKQLNDQISFTSLRNSPIKESNMQPTFSFKAETSIDNDIPTINAPTFIRPTKRLKTRYNKESNEPIVSVEFGTALNSAHSSNFIDPSMRTLSGNSNSSIFSLHKHTNKLNINSRNNSFEESALSRQSSIGSDEFFPTIQQEPTPNTTSRLITTKKRKAEDDSNQAPKEPMEIVQDKLTIYSRNNSFEEAALSRQSSIGSDEFLPTTQDPEEIVQEDVSTLRELRKEQFSKGSLKKAIRKGQEIPITTSPEVWTSAVEDLMKKGIKLPENVPVYTETVVTNLRSSANKKKVSR